MLSPRDDTNVDEDDGFGLDMSLEELGDGEGDGEGDFNSRFVESIQYQD